MRRFKVKDSSANIKEVLYSGVTKTLYIKFKNGAYSYSNVDKKVYNKFKEAESTGKFFHKYIRDKYKTNKLED